ncbi:hypothetical protein K8R33_01830 [archaeon]|nr:hypothetical protein [archaeon]
MVDNFRDPNNKYMKIEDVLAMNISLLTPIEVGTRPHCQNDVDRGDILETQLLYYAGVEKQTSYDTLRYHERLIDEKPVDSGQGMMLPIIDFIKPLRRD